MITNAASADKRYPRVKFTSVSATLDPVIVATGTIKWRWADGTESTTANPGSKDMSGTDGRHSLEVRAWDTITELDMNTDGLTEFEGLQYLRSLTDLNLANNSLTDIGTVTNLTGLTDLYLYSNSLTDIGRLNTQHSMTSVYLQDNSFAALAVDRALCDVAESVAAYARTGTMNISSNTAPTDGSGTGFDGVQAKADLIAAGWTVTTD